MEGLSENRRLAIRTNPLLISDNHSARSSEANISLLRTYERNETGTTSCDPLTILVPMTDACLIVMAIIFIIALAIVALIVSMAIIKVYFSNGIFKSVWTDS